MPKNPHAKLFPSFKKSWPVGPQQRVRRVVHEITPEDDARVDAKIVALREPAQNIDPSIHTARQILADAGIQTQLDSVRVKISDLTEGIATAFVPLESVESLLALLDAEDAGLSVEGGLQRAESAESVLALLDADDATRRSVDSRCLR